jgi:hypothetical protein
MTPTTARINVLAGGVWATREDEEVTVVDVKPNGRATGVLRKDAKRTAYIPTSWLDFPEPEVRTCPTCGQAIEEESA